MGWMTDDSEHEGWDAAEFPGDRYSTGTAGGGALVRRFPPDPGPLRDQGEPEKGVDGREAIGWRGLCECGWRGPLWQRVATPAEHDPAERRIYHPGLDQYGDAPEDVTRAIRNEWSAHLEPETLTAVRRQAQEVAAAQARLTDAVRAARADGRSWADIGAAAGITRQAAHERWARVCDPAGRTER